MDKNNVKMTRALTIIKDQPAFAKTKKSKPKKTISPLKQRVNKPVPAPVKSSVVKTMADKKEAPVKKGSRPVAARKVDPEASDALKFRYRQCELLRQARRVKRERSTENEKRILAFAREHNKIMNRDVRGLTGLKSERARQYLNKLKKGGKLVQFGRNGPKVFYKPVGRQ